MGLEGLTSSFSEGDSVRFSYLGPGAGPQDLAALLATPVKDRMCFAGERRFEGEIEGDGMKPECGGLNMVIGGC